MRYQNETVNFWDWVITLLVLLVPVVNFVMIFVWAFGGGVNESKANFARASIAIGFVFAVLFFRLFLI